jgi:hypothetical protein
MKSLLKPLARELALLAVVFAGVVQSQAQTTGNINLSGTVSGNTEITISGTGGAGSLDLSGNQIDLKIADINEKTNKKAGYTVTLTSANIGVLKNGTLDSIPYSIKYGVAGSLANVTLNGSGAATVTDVSDKTGSTGVNKELRISYTIDFPAEGTYTDTITLTIATK